MFLQYPQNVYFLWRASNAVSQPAGRDIAENRIVTNGHVECNFRNENISNSLLS